MSRVRAAHYASHGADRRDRYPREAQSVSTRTFLARFLAVVEQAGTTSITWRSNVLSALIRGDCVAPDGAGDRTDLLSAGCARSRRKPVSIRSPSFSTAERFRRPSSEKLGAPRRSARHALHRATRLRRGTAFNTAYGHTAGDELLRHYAHVRRRSVRLEGPARTYRWQRVRCPASRLLFERAAHDHRSTGRGDALRSDGVMGVTAYRTGEVPEEAWARALPVGVARLCTYDAARGPA